MRARRTTSAARPACARPGPSGLRQARSDLRHCHDPAWPGPARACRLPASIARIRSWLWRAGGLPSSRGMGSRGMGGPGCRLGGRYLKPTL